GSLRKCPRTYTRKSCLVPVFTFRENDHMNRTTSSPQHLTRRAFLGRSSAGMGLLALGLLLGRDRLIAADGSRGVVNPLHFAPKAKRIIWLYMAGGPSHLETFDYRPVL